MISLRDLIHMSEVSPVLWAGDARFDSLTADSRKVKPGACFVCMPSATTDSHGFLENARKAGAVAAIVHNTDGFERAVELGFSVLQLSTENNAFNRDLGLMCREFYSDLTLDIRVIGITGTNGKTTCAWLLWQALRAVGREAAYLGTLGYQGAGALEELGNTTPFPVELWERLAQARDEAITDLVMEVSSHSLDQHRIAGVRFDLGVFTNLSQDHLDYHGTMEAYALAKKALFTEVAADSEKAFVAIINADDPVGKQWLTEWAASTPVSDDVIRPGALADTGYVPVTLSYGFHGGTVIGEVGQVTFDQLSMMVRTPAGTAELEVPIGGRFNLENVLTVSSVLYTLGFSPTEISEAMSQVQPVPGRFEPVVNNRGVGVIVDYAHTDDAMAKLLSSARELNPNRLICVFGCGGDRDRTKRPKMTRVSTTLADVTVLTSDNPRTEDPQQILEDMLAGVEEGAAVEVNMDRAKAIHAAIEMAEEGDLVVIAGKGHETYQIVGREKHPFDDRKVAREALRARGES